jgi:hypothetical protein
LAQILPAGGCYFCLSRFEPHKRIDLYTLVSEPIQALGRSDERGGAEAKKKGDGEGY